MDMGCLESRALARPRQPPLIKTLYDADLMDESVMGDYADYNKILVGRDQDRAPKQEFDILETYQSLGERAKTEAEWRKRSETLDFGLSDLMQMKMPRIEPLEPIPPQNPTTFVRAEPKIGRNDPCPCESGRKYKHCHGK